MQKIDVKDLAEYICTCITEESLPLTPETLVNLAMTYLAADAAADAHWLEQEPNQEPAAYH